MLYIQGLCETTENNGRSSHGICITWTIRLSSFVNGFDALLPLFEIIDHLSCVSGQPCYNFRLLE
jgi:hypothetical protein